MAQKDKPAEASYQLRNHSGGIANFAKEDNNPYAYAYSQCIDTRSDAYLLTLLPAALKESGGVVTDLLKFGDITPTNLTAYLQGDTGNFYSRTSTGSWAFLHQIASSHGNGLGYFYGDDYVYYTGDMALGRYGPLGGTPTFSDDFLTAQGGVPQNTYSLLLTAASSQSADAVDSASLSITGSLTLESYIYLNSLPAVGSSMSIVGKWDESGTLRSYLMDIFGISGRFGDGSSSALTISADTTQSLTDSACTGTSGAYTLSATNAGFSIGQRILIWQTQGTNAGQEEENVISDYTAGTITLQTPLQGTYTTGAQVIVIPQYTNITINSGKTWTAKAWNGTVGGRLVAKATGTLTNNGTIFADGKGFRGGATNNTPPGISQQGEGYPGVGTFSSLANGNGGGGGQEELSTGKPQVWGGGGGGSLGSQGTNGASHNGGTAGVFGNIAGSNDLTSFILGGGGGVGSEATPGGDGGGGVSIDAVAIVLNNGSLITSGGTNGTAAAFGSTGSGAGSGGPVRLRCQTATLGTNLITVSGGVGGTSTYGTPGGDGGLGRVVVDYLTSFTGSAAVLNTLQDNSLVTTASYQLRLHISSTGNNNEILTQNLSTLAVGQWNRFSINWLAASSLATFYVNGSTIGNVTGTLTAIHDNTSKLYVGANKGASAIGNYLDGYIDDVRVWSGVQTAANIYSRNNHQLTGNEGGLVAYYKLNNAATDSSPNANNLTLRNSPVYSSTQLPFVDATTRLDIDQSFTTIGNDYDLLTSISELAVDSLTFTPANDPQKSVDFNIGTKGTGDWTVTVHDTTNRVIATKTITNVNMASSGYQEFVWDTPWRIVINKQYHFHVTSTVADGTIVTSTDDDFSTANFHTYYQFLVTDTFSHPIARMLNFMVILNERYLAKWDGAFYTPNLIAFPAGTHARCYGYWGNYIAIGTWQEAATGIPNVYDFPTGKIYFWDGISLTFNFSIDVPEGQVNAIYGMDADLYYIAGYKADLMYYHGGFANQSGSFNGTKAKRIPYLERSSYIETYPSAMAMWQGLLYFGMGGKSDSFFFPRNIYSWGTLYPQYQQTLTSDYVISTGNNGSSVKLGLVMPVGKKLLIGWQDGIAYGCDAVDPAGPRYTSGYLQTTIQDGGEVWREDLILKTRADHLALSGAEQVQIGSYPDRATHFDVEHSATDPSGKFTVNPLENGRVSEYQMQVNLMGDGTSSPVVTAIAAMTNPLDQEDQF